MDRERLTSHLQGEEEQAVGRQIIDGAELAWKTNQPQVTDFFDPHQRKVARSIVDAIPEIAYLVFGGYGKAERARLVIYPQFYLAETIPTPIRVLDVTGNFKFQKVSHRDFLGSLLGTGIKGEKVGDLLITDEGCQVVVAAEIGEYLLTSWGAVHQVPISVKEIDPQQIAVEPERVKEIKTTVAALRLDAVASAGFGTSRTKMTREIKGERVKVNWKVITNPSFSVEEKDVISIRGRGRVVVEEVRGETRKGRVSLLLQRLV